MVFDPYSSIPYTNAEQNDGGHNIAATLNGAAPAAYDMAIILVSGYADSAAVRVEEV